MEDQSKKSQSKSRDRDLARPPAKPGPRNGVGKAPSNIGEGNASGSKAGLDANDKTRSPSS